MKPTIVTHRRPHLDEICAIWIIQKYWPQFANADVAFVSTGPTGGDRWNEVEPDSTPFVIYVGVGQGRFDEHKGDTDESAATLVWQHTKEQFKPNKGESQAIDRLVQYVKAEDFGRFIKEPNSQFTLPTILSGLYGSQQRDSATVVEIGVKIMEALMFEMLKRLSAEKDWEGRVEFETEWGPGAAVITDVPGVERLAYQAGFVLLVSHNQVKTYHGFRADPDSQVDLSNVAMRLQQLNPEAAWFLHQSKRMLLCGGEITNGEHPSTLTLEQLVELVKR